MVARCHIIVVFTYENRKNSAEHIQLIVCVFGSKKYWGGLTYNLTTPDAFTSGVVVVVGDGGGELMTVTCHNPSQPGAGVRVLLGYKIVNPYPNPGPTRDPTRDNP